MSLQSDMHESNRDRAICDAVMGEVAYAVIAANGVLVQYSGLFAEYFGMGHGLVGLPARQVFAQAPSFLTVVHNSLRDAAATSSQLIYMERDNQLAHVLVNVSRIGDFRSSEHGDTGNAPPMLFLCTWLDQLVALETQMVRNDKLATAGKIAAGVAHEIRNPLTSIRGFAQILLDQFTQEKRDREKQYTQLMLTEIDRVNLLVNELLLLSKPATMTLAKLHLEDVVQRLATLVKSDAILHGVNLVLTLKKTPYVQIDSDMFKQVLLNLVRNALEAMESAGTLTISVYYDEVEDKVCLNVTDTGPGIPNYMIDRIFDAFYTTKETGIGLGLPVCQRIVSEFGGEMRVHAKGYGATFSVLLPVVEV